MSHESQIAKPEAVVRKQEAGGIQEASNDAWSKKHGTDLSQSAHSKSKGNGEDILPAIQITMDGDKGHGKDGGAKDADAKHKMMKDGDTDGGEKAKQLGKQSDSVGAGIHVGESAGVAGAKQEERQSDVKDAAARAGEAAGVAAAKRMVKGEEKSSDNYKGN